MASSDKRTRQKNCEEAFAIGVKSALLRASGLHGEGLAIRLSIRFVAETADQPALYSDVVHTTFRGLDMFRKI
jgi:hypothetical protein